MEKMTQNEQLIAKANRSCNFVGEPFKDNSKLRAAISNKTLTEGVKIVITPSARIEYRAKGGHFGSYRTSKNIDAIVTNVFLNPAGNISRKLGNIPNASVRAVDSDGKEYKINLSICGYSNIDRAAKNNGQYPIEIKG